MIAIDIPGFGPLEIEHLVLDYNGTLALDGELLPGVAGALMELSRLVGIHVLTADTFGRAASKLEGIPCVLHVLPPDAQDKAKARYVSDLGAGVAASVGNGRNDALMLSESRLGIAVVGGEGASSQAILAADVVVGEIAAAFGLLLNPLRLTATLRT